MESIGSIIHRYRVEKHLSLAKFSEALLEMLPGETLTQQAVSAWECGKTTPRNLLMFAIQATYNDWRSEMAAEVLEVLQQERSVVKKGADGVLKHL